MQPVLTAEQIQQYIRELGPWFHNLNLGGFQTAPQHFLGDYPRVKWQRFADALPAELHGQTVLDIGCNGGFYALEMKRRGAERVVGIDSDPLYLAQARFAAEVSGVELELHQLSVYDVAKLGETFDLVLDLSAVPLDEVADAMRLLAARAHVVAEGAGALALAVALRGDAGEGRIVCIVSGGNVDAAVLARVLAGETP